MEMELYRGLIGQSMRKIGVQAQLLEYYKVDNERLRVNQDYIKSTIMQLIPSSSKRSKDLDI